MNSCSLHRILYLKKKISNSFNVSRKLKTVICNAWCKNIINDNDMLSYSLTFTMKLWHWKSHWKFLWHWKDTETTLKNIYKGNHSDNPGLSHWNIFLCCSRTLKSHWKVLNHTEKFSALLIPFVPRFFSVTVNFQCDFQCHNFIVINNHDVLFWQKNDMVFRLML